MKRQIKKLLAILLALMLLLPAAAIASDDVSISDETDPVFDAEEALVEEQALPAVGEPAVNAEVPAADADEAAAPEEELIVDETPAAENEDASAEEEIPQAEEEPASDEPAEEAAEEPEAEDPAETLEQMEADLPGTLPDAWNEALVAVAQSQLGYAQDDSGYSRYADWCARWAADYCTDGWGSYQSWSGATAYDKWDAAFVTYALYYAGIPAKELTAYADAESWAAALADAGLLLPAEDYEPTVGDLVFLDWDDENDPVKYDGYGSAVLDENGEEVLIPTADTVGIVSWTDGSLWAITGTNRVAEVLLQDDVLGYAKLPVKPVPAAEEEDAAEQASEEMIEEAASEEIAQEAAADEAVESWTVDNHIFAPEGYLYLTVPDDLSENETYTLGGEALYYDPAESVFFAMVPADTEVALEAVEGERNVLEYSADINEDGVVNIADANAIYQMVQNGGDYYGVDQISIEARLRLDYHTIVDFDSVINLINGVG